MSGHSKWATIKRKKGDLDAKRGKIFTKLVREITTAARLGGSDVNGNPRLRSAVSAAKAARMPADNIERAIKKGTGALEGPPVEETNYEGYGPGGVAIYVEAQTDNRNRTTSDVRAAFAKHGGNMGATGSVAWLFRPLALFVFPTAQLGEERAMELGIESGADDVRVEDDMCVIEADPKAFGALYDALEKAGVATERAELTLSAENTVPVAAEDADRIERLVEKLEDLDDVQRVFANGVPDDAPAGAP